MSRGSWSDGYKKVSRKARTGSGRSKAKLHTGHHKVLPSISDREHARDRRRLLSKMREAELLIDDVFTSTEN